MTIIGAFRCDHSSTIALVNGERIFVDNYHKKDGDIITCDNGHRLVFVNGQRKRKFFRHYSESDLAGSGMTDWHRNWQLQFDDIEHRFPCVEGQIRTRDADVLLPDGLHSLELQHSKITRDEVSARKRDYHLHGIAVIWLLDGKSSVQVHSSHYGEFLEFSKRWMYESFIDYEYVYVQVEDRICIFKPNDVLLSKMVTTHSMDVSFFTESILAGNPPVVDLPRYTLTIKQQGAGNGKTYGMIKNIFLNEFAHYETYVIITKLHSAKVTIKEKFLEVTADLINEGILDGDNYLLDEDNCILDGKAFTIPFMHNGTDKLIAIATLDSFTWRFANHDEDSNSLLAIRRWAENITNNNLMNNNITAILYNGHRILFNKRTMVILDEAQDLEPYYANSLLSIANVFHTDLYIVGDLLQSIQYENNSFNFINDYTDSTIRIIKPEPSNRCRRFKNPKLRDFVNKAVSFGRWELGHVTLHEENDEEDAAKQLAFIQVSTQRPREKYLNAWVEKIMNRYKYEVEHKNRSPNDFLIIFPIINCEASNALCTAINIYWSTKGKGYITSNHYCILHKSEEGSSINLNQSLYSTRIVSIHASKGDGRPVVFALNLSEDALIRHDSTRGLKYESLLHVALTRQEQALYISYADNMLNDDIGRRIRKYINTKNAKPQVRISNMLLYGQLLDHMLSENNFSDLRMQILDHTTYKWVENERTNKQIIDMGHHHIRYATMFMTFIIEIINHANMDDKNVKGIIDCLKTLRNKEWAPAKGSAVVGCRSQLGSFNAEILNNNIVHLKKGGTHYKVISDGIFETMKRVHRQLVPAIINRTKPEICVYESLVFNYMYEMFAEDANDRMFTNGWKSAISIDDLYHITEAYYSAFEPSSKYHQKCACNKLFGQDTSSNRFNTIYAASRPTDTSAGNRKELQLQVNKEKKFLKDHYDSIIDVRDAYRKLIKAHPMVKWRFFRGFIKGCDDICVHPSIQFPLNFTQTDVTFIGESMGSYKLIYLRPTFGSLNWNLHLAKTIYNEYVLRYKYGLKGQIQHIVFTTKELKCYPFEYDQNLLRNARGLLDHHYNEALIRRMDIIAAQLEMLYRLTIESIAEKQEKVSFRTYLDHAKQFLPKHPNNRYEEEHIIIVNSLPLSRIYHAITSGITPEDFGKQIRSTFHKILCA